MTVERWHAFLQTIFCFSFRSDIIWKYLCFSTQELFLILPQEYYLVQFSEDSVLLCEIILRGRSYTQLSEAPAMSLNTQFLLSATGILVEQSFLCRYRMIPAVVLSCHSIK